MTKYLELASHLLILRLVYNHGSLRISTAPTAIPAGAITTSDVDKLAIDLFLRPAVEYISRLSPQIKNLEMCLSVHELNTLSVRMKKYSSAATTLSVHIYHPI